MSSRSHPFADPSPPRQPIRNPARSFPASASESALARTAQDPPSLPPPAQPSRVRPFLLRSSSPAPREGVEKPKRGSVMAGMASKGKAKLARSQTTSCLEDRTAGPVQPAPVELAPQPSGRRSLKPLSALSSAATLRLGSSRRTVSSVATSTPSSPVSSTPPSPTTTPSTSKLQAVEQKKIEMKRATIMARKKSGIGLGAVLLEEDESEGSVPGTRKGIEPPVEKSKRWLSKLGNGESKDAFEPSQRRKATFGGDLTNSQSSPSPLARRSRSPTPPFAAASSPIDRSQSLTRPAPSLAPSLERALSTPPPTRRPLRLASTSPVRGPEPASDATTHEGARKRCSYAALGLSKPAEIALRATPAEGEGQAAESEAARGDESSRHKEGYASLQELLEARGYKDTRVITPTQVVRKQRSGDVSSPASKPPFPTSSSLRATSLSPESSSLAPPRPTLKDKASMLSLRGLFSLWSGSSAEPEPTAEDDPEELIPDNQSDAGSEGTVTHSPISRAREWATGVALSAAADHPYPSTRSSLPASRITRPLPVFRSTSPSPSPPLVGSPLSSRSYSSSISSSGSPSLRSPPATHSFSTTTVALDFSVASAESPTKPTASSGMTRSATKTLRHVYSDPILSSQSGYQSFSFGEPPSLSLDFPDDASDPNSPPAPPHASLAPPPSRSLEVGTAWLPSVLRQRASQVFQLGLGLTSTTGALPLPATAVKARQAGKGAQEKRPQLLRKAVSTAGLVRPVLTKPEAGDELDEAGEHGGEDLLGRKWIR
ncbi:hypothetical protein JCM1840_002126 [Sporobolomyces johnsonii]